MHAMCVELPLKASQAHSNLLKRWIAVLLGSILDKESGDAGRQQTKQCDARQHEKNCYTSSKRRGGIHVTVADRRNRRDGPPESVDIS
jgi:hypothetical protein